MNTMNNFTIASQIAASFFSTEHEADRVRDLQGTIQAVLDAKDIHINRSEEAEVFFKSAMLNLIRSKPNKPQGYKSYSAFIRQEAVELTCEMLDSLAQLEEISRMKNPTIKDPKWIEE